MCHTAVYDRLLAHALRPLVSVKVRLGRASFRALHALVRHSKRKRRALVASCLFLFIRC
jgi:hypothetical protein